MLCAMSTNGDAPRDWPAYLDEMEVGEEHSIRARIDELETQLASLKRALDDTRSAKRILFVSGEDLRQEVVRFLNEDLHVPARAKDQENLFGMNDDTGDWGMGMSKVAADGNVTKGHLAEMMLHRSQAGFADDAPALLVVNTFQQGQTIAERDEPVASDVLRRAAEDHVVVVRTIDLLRLGLRAANGFPAAEQLTNAMRVGGGWLEVDATLNASVHGADETAPAALG
jgi:hypothetical protein